MRAMLALLLMAGVMLPSGCVRRRLLVRSNPPGARVLIDDQPIGVTPVATSYVYYGTRKIQLIKDGYQIKTVLFPMPTPWYEIPPLDFVSENLVPGELRDERVVSVDLEPERPATVDQVLRRGQQLRSTVTQGFVIPSVPKAAAPNPEGERLPEPVEPVRRLPLIEPPGQW